MSRSAPPRLDPASAASPCVSVCVMDPDGNHCLGCFRTLEEIGGWSGYGNDQRRQVLLLVEERRNARREQRRAQRRARTRPTASGS